MLSNSCLHFKVNTQVLTDAGEHGKPPVDELEMVFTCVVSISMDCPPCLSSAVPVLATLQTATAVLSHPEPF
jgi:hypothetical protein